jgi:hypothetical protein
MPGPNICDGSPPSATWQNPEWPLGLRRDAQALRDESTLPGCMTGSVQVKFLTR